MKESYIKIAKMLLILTVLGSGIGEKLYKTVTKKHKYEKIIKEKLQKRVSV